MNPTTDAINDVIGYLSQIDVRFSCMHATPTGAVEIRLTPGEVLIYSNDPAKAVATYYEVSRVQYLGWHQSNFAVICAGTTSSGRPCRNAVPGGIGVDPRRWVELQGGYCHVHG